MMNIVILDDLWERLTDLLRFWLTSSNVEKGSVPLAKECGTTRCGGLKLSFFFELTNDPSPEQLTMDDKAICV